MTLELDVVCEECHNKLGIRLIKAIDIKFSKAVLFVIPCAHCLKEERKEGRREGYIEEGE